MINQQVLSGQWDELSGKLRAQWGQVDRRRFADFQRRCGAISWSDSAQDRETREAVERFLDQLTDERAGVFSDVLDKVEETAGHAADSARECYEALRQGYAEAEKVVQHRPGQSVAIAFGLGLLGEELEWLCCCVTAITKRDSCKAGLPPSTLEDKCWMAWPESFLTR